MELATQPWVIPALVFASVALLAFVFASGLADRRRLRERYAGVGFHADGRGGGSLYGRGGSKLDLDAQKLGLSATAQRQLRDDLIRAGHFGPDAVVLYTLARALLIVLVPLGAYWYVQENHAHWSSLWKFGTVAVSFPLAYYLGKGYLDRRLRLMQGEYRLFFPEFLDMLVVCVDAGLSLEGALERVSDEIAEEQRGFRTNLQLMMAEMRAGKSTVDALHAFSDRLGLAEAKSLVTLLNQSLELGTDVALALSTYSDDMRDKRLSRAEEKAMALPVKLTLPLALCILPTLFIAILTPAVLSIVTALVK